MTPPLPLHIDSTMMSCFRSCPQKTAPLTLARVLERLLYDKTTGIFRWKRRLGNPIAGRLTSNGYVVISMDNLDLLAHKLVIYIHYGVWGPEPDHKNGIRNDNRLDNLEILSRSQNVVRAKRRHSSDMRGIRYRGQSYQVRIKRNYKEMYIGSFFFLQDAKDARDAAEAKHDQ